MAKRKIFMMCLMTVIVGCVLSGTPGEAAKKPYAGETITVALHAGTQSTPFYDYVGPFEQETGVKVKVVEIPYVDMYSKIMIELSGETGALDIVAFKPSCSGDFIAYLLPGVSPKFLKRRNLER